MNADDRSAEAREAPAPSLWEWLLALGGVLVLCDALDRPLYVLFGVNARLFPGLPIARIPLLLVVVAAGLLLARDRGGARRGIAEAWPLWPAVGLAFVSALWSEQPGTTLFWATGLLATTAFGFALAVRFSAADQVALVAVAIASIALATVAATMMWPAKTINARNAWRGIFVHKNLLGRVLALGVAASFVAASRGRDRAAAFASLLLCGGLLLQTRSRASLLVALATVCAAALLLAACRWRRRASLILASGAIVAVLMGVSLLATRTGLELLARSETFSDRTVIWKGVATTALARPWIGHGYAAFWPSSAGATTQARIRMRRPIAHAHNGAVDLFAELGALGLVLVLVPLALFAAASISHALERPTAACIWPATYLVFFVASNVAESAFLRHKLYWALYVAVACHLAAASRTPAARAGAAPHRRKVS